MASLRAGQFKIAFLGALNIYTNAIKAKEK
jgi:hypothetical protein